MLQSDPGSSLLVRGPCPSGVMNVQIYAKSLFCKTEPNWDPSVVTGTASLIKYQKALLEGLKEESKKVINMGKFSEVFKNQRKVPVSCMKNFLRHFSSIFCLTPKQPKNNTW